MEARRGSQAALTTTTTTITSDHDDTGPYTLRDLIKDIPLGEHPDGTQAHITSVDTWSANLYIGTSAGQVLHYVSIPPDPSTPDEQPSYIFATKLEPSFTTQRTGTDAGVKQILLVPNAGKACILCNGTLTFYTLPELSPAFGGKIKQPACLWIGGLDGNEHRFGGNAASGTVIVICLRQRLRLIRIGEDDTPPRKIRDIELGGVGAIQRREDLACVAEDGKGYSLLDVVNQRKNELFPISSLSATPDPPAQEAEVQSQRNREASRSFSSRSPVRLGRGHDRNVSLGGQPLNNDRLRPDSSSPWPARGSSRTADSPAQPGSRDESPAKPGSAEASARTSAETSREAVKAETVAPAPEPVSEPLPPNILTPTPNEFLLTTGTRMNEPGVGIFVNLDGDVVRGTIEFSTYPTSLVLDGGQQAAVGNGDGSGQAEQEGYVLALVTKELDGKVRRVVEVQRWDAEPGESEQKQWLAIPSPIPSSDDGEAVAGKSAAGRVGLRLATTIAELNVPEISSSLRLRRLLLLDSSTGPHEGDTQRNEEEDRFASRFSRTSASVLLYHDDQVSWLVRSALLTRLEKQLDAAVQHGNDHELTIDVPTVQSVVNAIRGQEAKTELDFLTLTYIRQKASLLLFGNLLLQTAKGVVAYEHEKRRAEEALVAGEIDPRTILTLLPPLAVEVEEGEQGIWIAQGLRDTIAKLRQSFDPEKLVQDPKGAYGDNLLQLVKRYLSTWRKKKGFGSVADEKSLFLTVDAALLHLLLLLDQHSSRGPAAPGTVRAELNEVVDKGVDCFDRAEQLFEHFGRLYMLSRLYQSKKMTKQVLATWRRILEGEKDTGGELLEGEMDVRRYLVKLRDAALVNEYGSWLANRNPKLGVQVFADETARVKFQPAEAVAILKEKAPGAVKDYLEHLVFGKNHVKYVNDLIAFYLDTVLHELEHTSSAAGEEGGGAKQILLDSYSTYRALRPPKPTYRQFITDNAIPAEWWHNRLRLLQLIGGSHGAASAYDVHALGERLAPYSEELVPEMIILNGREGKHEEAIRLLVHGLGDYDTAIRYCLLGGSRIFYPGGSSGLAAEEALPTHEEQARLFATLLDEFFRVEDLSERLERTAELLERFGGWFDVEAVVARIPDSWSVELVSGFLIHAFRRLLRERNETVVVKALSSAQNLRQAVECIGKTEGGGPVVVRGEVDAG